MPRPAEHPLSGLAFAVVSALSFATSGTLAKGLIGAGWSPAGAVTARVIIAALVLAPPTVWALRGQWQALRNNLGLVVAYGFIAVAGTQLAYFSAVEHLQVGLALLIEYTAPVAVVGWLWLRHGERPGLRTVLGAVVAAMGLLLVLDVLSGVTLSRVGLTWALLAMVGAAIYFVLSARADTGLPPVALAGAGLLVGALALLLAGAVGVIDVRMARAQVSYAGHQVAWWLPVVLLGVVSAALAYVTGIAASRRLGSRLASFVALLEVVAALVFAWIFLGETPGGIQLVGGLLILVGVIVVKLGERVATAHPGGV